MPYNPNNNPYIPGDPYSYDLKWMVSKTKELITQAQSAEDTANAALSAANAANTTAGNAVNTANSASTAAGNAVNTANTALSAANAANTTAGNAVNTANSASTAAGNAVNTANTAANNASAALTAATHADSYEVISGFIDTANSTVNVIDSLAYRVGKLLIFRLYLGTIGAGSNIVAFNSDVNQFIPVMRFPLITRSTMTGDYDTLVATYLPASYSSFGGVVFTGDGGVPTTTYGSYYGGIVILKDPQ